MSLCDTSSQREYKKALEQEIKGKGMLALATDTPDFMRARNATDILSQVGITPHLQPHASERAPSAHGWFSSPQTKYKHNAEMDRATYTTVIDTPDILHAQQMKNIVSQVGQMKPHRRRNLLLAAASLFVLLFNRKGTRRKLRRPCLTTYQFWTLRRCRGSVRTRRTSVL